MLQFCLESQYRRAEAEGLRELRAAFKGLNLALREDEGLDHVRVSHIQLLEIIKQLHPAVPAIDFIQEVITPQKHMKAGDSYHASRVLQALFLVGLAPPVRLKLGWEWGMLIPDHSLAAFVPQIPGLSELSAIDLCLSLNDENDDRPEEYATRLDTRRPGSPGGLSSSRRLAERYLSQFTKP